VEKYWQWVKGRQNPTYEKFLIFQSKRLKADCYLLRYGKNSYLKSHIDATDKNHRHYRANLVLKNSRSGGVFKCKKTILDWPRLKVFEAGKYSHSLTKILEGNRLVLSIGIRILK